ncbi:MAG TPA: hypothetical protein VHM92_09985 [Allosphingosinicella sp.]|nr:hypothetical protein [Allosphingosinicella sp.]
MNEALGLAGRCPRATGKTAEIRDDEAKRWRAGLKPKNFARPEIGRFFSGGAGP